MIQRHQHPSGQPITAYAASNMSASTRNPSYSNRNNLFGQRQRMQNFTQIKYQHQSMDHTDHPLYEGLDVPPNHTGTAGFNGVQYSNVTNVDAGFFGPNDYDNAASGVDHMQPMSMNRQFNNYRPSYVNGAVGTSRMTNITSQFDKSLSFKSNASNSASTGTFSQSSQLSTKFETIRRNCFASKMLYADSEFPTYDGSLFAGKKPNIKNVTWMRPGDIIDLHNRKHGTNIRPEFVVNGYERFDLNQGLLGDCWVLAALAALTSHDFERNNLLSALIPKGQSFQSGWYTGAFQFRFWRNGEWVDVVIDDRLPTDDGKLIFIHSQEVNEFWGALLEKAYAKLNGSYGALNGGMLADAMDDFTGGMTETFAIRSTSPPLPNDIDDHLIRAFERHSLITLGIEARKGPGINQTLTGGILANGLVTGHAYTLSDIRKIKLTLSTKESSIVTLLRIRNPWGNSIEWNGAWSDRSSEWTSISESDKKAVGLVFKADGEFWISLKDFLENFDTIDVCHLSQEVMPSKMQHYWHSQSFFGEWKINESAGGRPIFSQTHFTNPQFRFTLKEPSDGDKCTVLIGLHQEDPRSSNRAVASKNLSIGFVIYQAKARDAMFSSAKGNSYIASVDYFFDGREIVKRFKLVAGTYIVVPCTYEAHQPGRFLLRIFTESVSDSGHAFETATVSQIEHKLEPQKEIVVRQMFYRESGNEMALNAFQLQKLLNNLLRDKGFKYELSVEACKYIVVLFDQHSDRIDLTFKIRDDQFTSVWSWVLRSLKQIQASETIGPIALKTSLDSLQLSVSNMVLQNIVHRFGNESGYISASDYISIVAILTKAKESFDSLHRNNTVSLSREDFMNCVTRM